MAKGRPFPPKFRREAVRLHRASGGHPVSETAAELGISHKTLGTWLRQAQIDEGKAAGLASEKRLELQRLRRENKILKEEKEILKKAAFLRPGDR